MELALLALKIYLSVGLIAALAVYFAEDEKAIVEFIKTAVILAFFTVSYPVYFPYRIYEAYQYRKKQKGKIPQHRSARWKPADHPSDDEQ